jgi:hypothetical protein
VPAAERFGWSVIDIRGNGERPMARHREESMTCLGILLAGLAASGAAVPSLPTPPDVGGLVALAPRPTGPCNAATYFERAEQAFVASGRADAKLPLRALAPDDPVLALVLQGMGCRTCEFPYSRTMAIPPTEQRIPASSLYRSAAEAFVEKGRSLQQQGRRDEAEGEFRKAVVLGRLLFEDPGITVIQDAISLSVLERGAEGLGDLALARGDARRAETCARFLAGARAYLEGSSRLVKGFPIRGLRDAPSAQREAVAAIAALDAPGLRGSLRVEVLMFVALARPVVADPPPVVSQALERARRDRDPRIRALAEWGLRLDVREAQRLIAQLAGSPWP